jgi:murein DD-endopeptidase MepM/ murein hydrolase activator NlpD
MPYALETDNCPLHYVTMPTWIKETDQAFYLMEGAYYVEKIEKHPRPPGVGDPGEKVLSLEQMQTWFTGSDWEIPGAMVVAVGINAEEPQLKPAAPEPTLEILQMPDSVAVGEAFQILGRVPASWAGKAVDLWIEVNGTFYLQTTDLSQKPTVAADGSFQVNFRFSSPGNRRLKLSVDYLSQVLELEVRAVFSIIQIPDEVIAGEAFTITGTAPFSSSGELVRLFVNNQAQPSTVTVNPDGTWQLRFGLFSLGPRNLKVVVGNESETRPIRVVLTPLFGPFRVPETQLSSPNYPTVSSEVLGRLILTGGFMEPYGHSWKPTAYAIFSQRPTTIQTLSPSRRNYGIDYVVGDAGQPIHNWYPGRVTKVGNEGGYGLRCHIDFAVFLELAGRRYWVKGAYAHARSFSVAVGQSVKQGEAIGVMGNTGGNYPLHVDFRLWIDYQGRVVDVSPNVLEAQLRQQEKG